MTCLGVLERGARGDDNETGLKEEGGIEMSTTVLHGLKEGGEIEMSTTSAFHIRDARSLFAFVFTYLSFRCCCFHFETIVCDNTF